MIGSFEKLVSMFARFPGVGGRQAKRFAYFILSQNRSFAEELSSLVTEIKKNTERCLLCYRFFKQTARKEKLCDICLDPNVDKTSLMLVEKDMDLENIRKANIYNGLYFVLGGLLPILEENPSKKIRVKELLGVISERLKAGLKEIIIAISANPEGENTTAYILKTLEPISKKEGFKVSVLGRGISTGTELEYSDSDTIENALKNRG